MKTYRDKIAFTFCSNASDIDINAVGCRCFLRIVDDLIAIADYGGYLKSTSYSEIKRVRKYNFSFEAENWGDTKY